MTATLDTHAKFRENLDAYLPQGSEEARLLARIERGDAVPELGAGILSQQTKIALEERGLSGSSYTFGDDPVMLDEDGDGVDDRKQEDAPRSSAYRMVISRAIDDAMAALDRRLYQIDDQIATIDRQLGDLSALQSRLKQERALNAALQQQQEGIIANRKVAIAAAQESFDQQLLKTQAQSERVEDKKIEFAAQQEVVAQKTVEEQQAAQNLATAKENTAVKTEEKVAADQKVEAVAQSYKDMASGTLSYLNDKGGKIDVFKKIGPDGKEVLVDASGALLSEQTITAIREANKNADGTVPSDTELTAKAKTFDAPKVQSMMHNYRFADNDAVYKDTALKSAQKDEQNAQTLWESAAESLKSETRKLDTLQQELNAEQKKLDQENKILAEKRQKLEEEKKALVQDEAKLAELKARDKELAEQQEKAAAQQRALEERKTALTAERKHIEEAKTKLADPAYQEKLKAMGPDAFLAEMNKLPISAADKAALADKVRAAAPAPAAPSSPKPADTAQTAASPEPAKADNAIRVAPEKTGASAPTSLANTLYPDKKDGDVAQKAFAAAASPAQATPDKKLEDEPAPKTAAPSAHAPAAAPV